MEVKWAYKCFELTNQLSEANKKIAEQTWFIGELQKEIAPLEKQLSDEKQAHNDEY